MSTESRTPVLVASLTSTFTPPPECATPFAHSIEEWSDPFIDPWFLDCYSSKRSCFPGTGTEPATYTSGGYYSPGLYCPVNWKTITTVESFLGFDDSQLLPEETAIICCPRRVNIVVSVPLFEAFIDEACIRYMKKLVGLGGISQIPVCWGGYYIPEDLYYIECKGGE